MILLSPQLTTPVVPEKIYSFRYLTNSSTVYKFLYSNNFFCWTVFCFCSYVYDHYSLRNVIFCFIIYTALTHLRDIVAYNSKSSYLSA